MSIFAIRASEQAFEIILQYLGGDLSQHRLRLRYLLYDHHQCISCIIHLIALPGRGVGTRP
jgi:hypothetical protein